MSGAVGLPAPRALLKNFSVEDVDEVVKSSEFAQPCLALHWLEGNDTIYNVHQAAAAKIAIDSKAELPEGARTTSTNAHGASFWTQTARLDVVLPDGTETAYFLKVAKDALGKGMLQGEYESAKLLHSFSPNGLPTPVAFGTYASDPGSHFYLCAFIDMAMRIPDPAKFCAILAEMHQNSIGHSPEGKYGFHVSTYQGNMPQNNA